MTNRNQLMTYYLAANDRTLAVTGPSGYILTFTLKSHPFSKGLTKAQAAIRLMQVLDGRVPWEEAKPRQSLKKVLASNTDLAGLFYNNPPQEIPIAHATLFSLDTTTVEIWLRKVFGEFRWCLPPIVRSIQQEFETWTALRWTTYEDISKDPQTQVKTAGEVHLIIGDMVQERQARMQQGVVQ